MSGDKLGNKQTIIIHICLINNEKYDIVITPHRQSVGYIRTKRQTLRKKIINKQKQIIRKRFSKQRNAVSESETTAIHELHNLKDSKNKNHQIDDQLCFTDSETLCCTKTFTKKDNNTFRPLIKPSYRQHRNDFAEPIILVAILNSKSINCGMPPTLSIFHLAW